MNLNKVFILGRVTQDLLLRTTASGQSVTTFSVATNRYWNDKTGGRQEDTEFHNIVAWGKQAEVASQFLVKGALVLIEGRIQTRTWQDKQNQTRKVTEVICERLQLGPKPAGGGLPKEAESKIPKQATEEDIPIINLEEEIKVEDLPF